MNTLEEIISSFTDKCAVCADKCDYSTGCHLCDYSHIDEVSICERQYIYDVATGARDIEDLLTIIPAWFFKGAKVWNIASACWQTIEDYQVVDKKGTLTVDFVCHCGGEECGNVETARNVSILDYAEKDPFPDGTKPLKRVYNHTTRTIDTISYLSKDKDGTLLINGGPVSNYDLIPDWVKVGQKILFRDGRIQKINEIGDSKIMLESGDFILTEDICNSEELGFEPINLDEEISQKEKGNTLRKFPSLQLIRDIYETYQMALYDYQPEYDEFIHDIMSGADDITNYPLFRVYFKAIILCGPLSEDAFIEEDFLITDTSWDAKSPTLSDFVGNASSAKIETIRDYVDEWLDRVVDGWDRNSSLNAYDRSWFECDFGCSHEISFSFQIDRVN